MTSELYRNRIIVADEQAICIYHGTVSLSLNQDGNMPLHYKRKSHTHFYKQSCAKICPQDVDTMSSAGTDGFAQLWSYMKKGYSPFPGRNYQKEFLYHKDGSLPENESDDNVDTRTVGSCQTSEEDEPTEQEGESEDEDEDESEDLKKAVFDYSLPVTENQKIVLHKSSTSDAIKQDYGGTDAASKSEVSVDSLIPIGKKMFCNRPLNLKNIKSVGFDVEHTLAIYKPQEFGGLVFRTTIDKLVSESSYPKELQDWKFDCSYFVRGLVVDKSNGNILKVNSNNMPVISFHGSREMSNEEMVNAYRSEVLIQAFDEPDYASTDTFLSMVEAYVFSKLVDFIDDGGDLPAGVEYKLVYETVKLALDMCCRDGSIRREVLKDPSRYIHKDPEIVPMLKMIKESNCRTFLVTNSLWDYTNAVMNYICTPSSPDVGSDGTQDWLKYFDTVITGCSKPSFFNVNYEAALLTVELDSGKLLNSNIQMGRSSHPTEQTHKVYQGGSAGHLQRLLGVDSGSQIFYASEQIRKDILPSKKVLGWQTMLVIPELEKEIQVFSDSESARKELRQIRTTHASVAEKIRRLKWILRSEAPRNNDKEKLEHDHIKLLKDLDKLEQDNQVLLRGYDQKFNMRWGELMKAGNQSSRFAHKVKTAPCLYTSSITNLSYDWFEGYSPREEYAVYELDELELSVM